MFGKIISTETFRESFFFFVVLHLFHVIFHTLLVVKINNAYSLFWLEKIFLASMWLKVYQVMVVAFYIYFLFWRMIYSFRYHILKMLYPIFCLFIHISISFYQFDYICLNLYFSVSVKEFIYIYFYLHISLFTELKYFTNKQKYLEHP